MAASDKRRRPKSIEVDWRRSARGKRGPGCIARQVQLGRRQGPCVCDWCLWRKKTLGG